MILMTKQTALDYSDLRFLEITCGICSARIVVDAKDSRAHPPYQCPACSERFDTVAIQSPVQSFIDIYKLLTNEKQKTTFRVIVNE